MKTSEIVPTNEGETNIKRNLYK